MSKLEKVSDWFESFFTDNPNIRALLQLEPTGIGSAYEVMLSHKISEMRKQRFRIFMDELSKGEKELSPELIDSEDFLHAFFSTANASLNSRREEKIRLFGKLLLQATKANSFRTDIFEEFLSILDELSLREFYLLAILAHYERITCRDKSQNDLQFASSFWAEFEQEAADKLNISQIELPSLLIRLTRTGLFETFSGLYFDSQGSKGKTTPLFEKFSQWVDRDAL